NVRGRDIQSVVADVEQAVSQSVQLPDGYRVTYGGQFENLQNAQARLKLVVPAALLLILVLLYFSFGTVRESLLIFSAIPFAAVGGVLALWLRDMPFSISAGVGFIALFGVAVLNGMVLIGYFQQLQREGVADPYLRVKQGVMARFRPVVMTASVASLGFLPMAIASGAGAEVQKPLATVVIGGLISATLLTLVILPVLYAIFSEKTRKGKSAALPLLLIAAIGFGGNTLKAQAPLSEQAAVASAIGHHPALMKARHQVEEKTVLSHTNMARPPLQAYTWLPFNPEVGITQGFDPPALVKADRKVREGQLALSTASLQLTQLQVARDAVLAYERCRYARERAVVLARQDSLLADYLRVAEVEYRTGDISALARLNTEARSHEARRMAAAAQLEYRMARSALQAAALLEDSTWRLEPGFYMRPLAPAMSDLLGEWGQQVQQVAALEHERERKTLKPGFGVGVVTNVDPKNRFLPNAYFSINVPVFRKAQRAAIEAARMRQTIAADEVAQVRHAAQMRRQTWLSQWRVASTDLDFWNKTGEPQAAELLRAAALSRRAGESSTTEYLQAIAQAFSLQINHLDALWQHNEAVIQLHYWNVPESGL
ncbi:MAG TPA: efflux RND transporter permease subunit, partial [Saprospiraceae bacterium]|nr:efflux RND transporter permease subunit [Saprospiraceae bacterium]